MGWTKRQIITRALDEIGIADYAFDVNPEAEDAALRVLDAMMTQWTMRNIRLGWPTPGSPQNSNISADTLIPDWSVEAVALNLALRLAPSYGKTPSQQTTNFAAMAYDSLLMMAAFPQPVQLPASMPFGAGNKALEITQTFVSPPIDPLLAGRDGALEI